MSSDSIDYHRGMTQTIPVPGIDDAVVVVPAPAGGPGNWAGAPDATLIDGVYWLAWRERRPLRDGRGVSVNVARSGDGERFTRVAMIRRESFGAESFERPALVRLPDGRWRLYLSCATPGSKHWWVDTLTADRPEELARGERHVALPGDARTAVKDPVLRALPDGGWEMWLCCHPLDVAGAEDRMTTRRLTSADGLRWTDRGEVLTGTPGAWDARGARVTAVVSTDPLTVLYDGRPDAASNWHEVTGVATWDRARLVAAGGPPLRSPHSDGALRYAAAVPLPDGRTRFYFEAARPDGAHDLVTSVA